VRNRVLLHDVSLCSVSFVVLYGITLFRVYVFCVILVGSDTSGLNYFKGYLFCSRSVTALSCCIVYCVDSTVMLYSVLCIVLTALSCCIVRVYCVDSTVMLYSVLCIVLTALSCCIVYSVLC
jgi:hypothetical protein